MPIKTTQKNKQKTTRQNRPSEIRLSGVTPIMHIKTTKKKEGVPQKNKKKQLVKIDPQKYIYQGSPLYYFEKPKKTKPKKNTGENRPSEIRLSGVPL